MAKTVLITLTIAGDDTGPFSLYSNVSGFVLAFETNISKEDLEAGYTSVLVPDATTVIRVQSSNPVCETYVDLTISTTTTTSSSSTSSTSTTSTTSTSTTVPPTTTTTTTVADETIIQIGPNSSVDVNINSILVDGVAPTYDSGQALPNTPGNITLLSTDQLGTVDITINYTAATPGRSIELVDSALNVQCQNLGTGTTDITFINVVVNASNDVIITPQASVC